MSEPIKRKRGNPNMRRGKPSVNPDRMYDGKATMITIALDDGADEDIIRTRVTHAKPVENAFDHYYRGTKWLRTCEELSKLRIVRRERQVAIAAAGGGSEPDPELKMDPLLTFSLQSSEDAETNHEIGGGGGSRTGWYPSVRLAASTSPTVVQHLEYTLHHRTERRMLRPLVTSHRTATRSPTGITDRTLSSFSTTAGRW